MAMRGLGFASPANKELQRAQLTAKLKGSTALPAGDGGTMPPSADQVGQLPVPLPQVGTPPSPESVGQLPVPVPQVGQGGAPQPQAPEPPAGGAPRWAQIAGAIGHVLLSADAGYRGRPMPEGPDAALRAQQDQEMQVTEFLVNTMARAWEVSRKAPPDARAGMLEQFKQAINRVAPDFDFDGFLDSMQTDADRADAMAPDLAVMSPEAKQMFMSQVRSRGGDAAAAADVMKDEKFMDGMREFEDGRNVPALKFKLHAVKAAMAKLGMPPDSLAGMSPKDFDSLNAQLPENARLSPSELATLRRHPQLGGIIGMRGPQDEAPTLDSRAGVERPPQARAPGAAAPVPQATSQAPSSPRRAPPPPPGRSRETPSPAAAAPQKGRKPPPPSPLGDAPITPPGSGPVYTRKGWDSRLADPAQQRELKKGAAKLGMGRGDVEQAIAESGEAPAAPPPRRAPPAQGQQAQQQQPPQISKGKRALVPRDMVIAGVGKVKKGEVIIWDPATGKYRRGHVK